MSDAPTEGGISGWLIRKKIVAKESQANLALLGVVIVAMVLAGMIFVLFLQNQRGLANPDKSLILRPQPTAPLPY